MAWRLTAETYWRREGEDVVLVTPHSILRLNATSTRTFLHLLRLEGSNLDLEIEEDKLVRLLCGEGMIASSGEEVPEAPLCKHLAHLCGPAS